MTAPGAAGPCPIVFFHVVVYNVTHESGVATMIRQADRALKERWLERFSALPLDARLALRAALLELREDALQRAELQWRRHKSPMAFYWKVVGVYAGHLARAIPRTD